MYSNKKNNNNDSGQPEISRQRSRPRLWTLPFIILIVVTVFLSQSLTEAAATDTATAQTDDTPVMATSDDTVQVSTPPEITSQAIISPDSTPQASASPDSTPQASASPDAAELFAYNANIPLDSEIQQYLFDLCAERNLDYKMCLSVIKMESNFKAKALGGGCNYGLFQINKCNHKKLSAALKTSITPYDPITNINWGTYLLSNLYEKYSGTYSGEDLLKAVLSAYNRGEGGFKKYGFAKSYIKGYYNALGVIETWFA